MALYHKPVKHLFKDMIKEFRLKKGEILNRERIYQWFEMNYPLVKPGTISAHILRMSTNAPSRIHHNVDLNDDLLFQIDSKRFRLYDPSSDPDPLYYNPKETDATTDGFDDKDEMFSSEFAYEKDLQNFLAKNLHLIEQGLSLYSEEDISGIEFPAGNRFIDILAVDDKNNYVVIELKVSRGYDRVVGQILRYMAWVKQNHAEEGQQVRGIIVAREISEDLKLACSEIENVKLYEYILSVTLKEIESGDKGKSLREVYREKEN